jgi:23S rRNA (cytosine1962-C5)-methyltransferase
MTMKPKYGGTISAGEIGLPITRSGMNLPCGILGRWES